MDDGSNLCRYSFGGQSFRCDERFDVFTSSNVNWFTDTNGNVPARAIHVGGNEEIYVGRISASLPWDIGSVDRQNRALFYSFFDGSRFVERWSRDYQVLRFN